MNVKTDIKLRDRLRVNLSGFKGLDTLSSPVDVSAIHGTVVENLISRDGVNHKRFGWQTKWSIRKDSNDPAIKGVFSFVLDKKDYIIAYADKTFFSLNEDNTTTIIQSNAEWEDVECKCFVNGNKAYFIGIGDYLVYDGTTLKSVVDDNPYIPTTTENIGSEEKGQHYTRITAEERNLLSPYAYNTLVGEILEVSDIASYILDTPNFENVEVVVNDSITLLTKETTNTKFAKGMTVNSNLEINLSNIVMMIEGEGFEGGNAKSLALPFETKIIEFDNKWSIKVNLKQYTSSSTDNFGGETYVTPQSIKAKVSLYNNDSYIGDLKDFEEVEFKYGLNDNNGIVVTAWTIEFKDWERIKVFQEDEYAPDTTAIANRNIQDIYYGEYYGAEEKWLESSDGNYKGQYNKEQGIIRLHGKLDNKNAFAPSVADKPNIKVKITLPNYNYSQVTTAINGCKFGLSGSDDRLFLTNENVVMWSKDEDFTYFGEKSWCVCGTKETKIKGLNRLNDSTLLIVKEYSAREPSVYVISGTLTEGVTEGGTVDYTAMFSPKGYQVGMGAIGGLTNFNGDCLMVCKDGVYAVTLGENMTVDARYIKHRSKQISNELEAYDLSQAKGIAFGGKYYLAIEDKCYVADNKYVSSYKNEETNYEWWKWTNVAVSTWGYINNDLCFGTTNGKICVFTNNFYDEDRIFDLANRITYCTNDSAILGFNGVPSTFVKGDKITIKVDFYGKVTTNKFDVEDGVTKLYVPLNDYKDNEIIKIDSVGYTVTKKSDYLEINYTTDAETIVYYKNYKDMPLTLDKEDGDEYMSVLNNQGEKIEWASVGLNPSLVDFKGFISHKMNIISKWVTGALDLGTRSHTKTLTKLIMTGEKDLANHLKYGIRTRVTNRNYEFLRANNDLDFEGLDLETLSLDSQFASSFVKRLNLRNVNFIQLYLIGDTEEDMAINSIEIEYKIIKNNIGVN